MNDRQTSPQVSAAAKLTLLGSLYFAQGLPFGFFTQALPVMMRKSGFSLGEIGLSSLLAVPWALKFVWAPAVDRHWSPRLGRRRSWILPLQLLAVVILATLALSGGARSLRAVMAATLLLNLVAASQDIATDGLAVDILAPSERGVGNGLQVAGYRVGMIVGGGALLVLYDRLGAPLTFLAMAALTALSTVPVGRLREPPPTGAADPARSGPHSGRSFLRRAGAWRLLAVVTTYKAGEAFAAGMLRPFLADLGLGLGDIGLLVGTVGFVAGLVGALVGGALMGRLGRRPALLVFGLLQAAAVASYALLAFHATHARPARSLLFSVCGLEHLTGGMATAALFTCMMDWCAPETSATDYTVQASAVVIATGLAATAAGASAQALGYVHHFGLATALALGTLLVVARYFPRSERTGDAAGALSDARRERTVPTCA
jgi:MFS transporter, PAT family, beta-lactamase induction signal transducer AmpG